MKSAITIVIICALTHTAFAQNFGIGTSVPNRLLHLGSSTSGANIIGLGSPSGSSGPHGIDFLKSDGSIGMSIYYRTTPNDLYIEDASGNQVVTFDQTGNVGIRTSSPQEDLDVNGTTRTQGFIRNCPSGYESIGVFCIDLTCRGPSSRSAAESACQSLGGRLCTAGELLTTSGLGCGYDATSVWVAGSTSRAFRRGNQSTSIGWEAPSSTEYYCCY